MDGRPNRQSGLGDRGRDRFRQNLNQGGADTGRYDDSMFGGLPSIPQPTTEWAFPSSSRVRAYQYDYDQQQLRVRFVKGGTPWVNDNVPMAVFQAFDSAPSKGRYVNSTLNYMTHRRASPQEEVQYFSGV